eukprot:8695139-Karenia_brevis.AAC.1
MPYRKCSSVDFQEPHRQNKAHAQGQPELCPSLPFDPTFSKKLTILIIITLSPESLPSFSALGGGQPACEQGGFAARP